MDYRQDVVNVAGPYSEEELALADIARKRETEKELADRSFRAGLKSAARWFDQFTKDTKIPAGRISSQLRKMSEKPDDFFFEEDDKDATDPDSPT